MGSQGVSCNNYNSYYMTLHLCASHDLNHSRLHYVSL